MVYWLSCLFFYSFFLTRRHYYIQHRCVAHLYLQSSLNKNLKSAKKQNCDLYRTRTMTWENCVENIQRSYKPTAKYLSKKNTVP